MGGWTWRLMHQGHSRGCAFLQFFLCLWGVSPAVSSSVSQFGQQGAIVARGKPPLRPFGACFGRVGRLVLAASLQKGWARTMGRVLEQLSARQVLLTRSMCVGGLGAQGTHAKSTKLHTCHKRSCRGLCKSPTGYHVEPTFQSHRPILGWYLMRYNSIS